VQQGRRVWLHRRRKATNFSDLPLLREIGCVWREVGGNDLGEVGKRRAGHQSKKRRRYVLESRRRSWKRISFSQGRQEA
jgi:hypothetical protein